MAANGVRTNDQQFQQQQQLPQQKVVRLAITEVVTETYGNAVHIALSPKELNSRQRKQLSRPSKRIKLLSAPCTVDISLKVKAFDLPRQRSEAWLYIGQTENEKFLRVIEDLEPVSVELCQPFRLSCRVEAKPEPEVTWYKNDVELTGAHYRRDVTVDGHLTLDVVESRDDDGGEYKVRVVNECGETASMATVRVVFERPNFVAPLRDLDVFLGTDLTFTCAVRGVPSPAVRWFVDRREISVDSANMQTTQRVYDDTGLIVTTLSVLGVTLNESRVKFTCRATNAAGECETTAKITTKAPARIVTPLKPAEIRYGSPAQFYCLATGWPRPSIVWVYNEQPIGDVVAAGRRGYTIETAPCGDDERALESLLVVEHVTDETAGKYTAVAANDWDTSRSTAQLTVEPEAPQFVERFHDQTLEEEETLALLAKVTGRPTPTIKWLINDNEVEPGSVDALNVQFVDAVCCLTLTSVKKSSGGIYTCTAENEAGLAKCVARITVTDKTVQPFVIKGPSDQTITEDEDCQFEASVGGQPRPVIQWFKGGVKLESSAAVQFEADAENHVLSIKKAQLDDEGSYSVVATNSVGEVAASANLTVKERLIPPKFIEKLDDVELVEGSEAHFRCCVLGKPLPRVTWCVNEREISDDTGRFVIGCLQGEKNVLQLSLTVNDLQLEDIGCIKVVAKNSVGEDDTSARLSVTLRTEKPSVVSLTDDLETVEGDDCDFEAVVSGRPRPVVKWLLHGTPVDESANFLITNEGEKHKLIIKQTELCHTGPIQVTAVNVAGEATAHTSLKVNVRTIRPVIISLTEDQDVIEGEVCQFEAVVNGKPEPRVEWFLHDKPLNEESSHFTIVKDGANHRLVVKDAEMFHAGEIRVKAVNVAGEAAKVTSLRVQEKLIPPEITLKLANLETLEGSEVCFRCVVTGKPLPVVNWFQQERELNADGADINIETFETDEKYVLTSSLKLTSVSLDDSSDVKVVAVNKAGQDTSVARLKVNMRTQKPMFVEITEEQEVTEGEDCQFEAVVNGKPQPRLEWFLRDKLLSDSSHFVITSDGSHHRLVVKDAELNHTGPIQVKAVNEAGEATATTLLKVNEKLIPPEIILKLATLETLEESDVCFRCLMRGKPLPSVKWFHKGVELTADATDKMRFEIRETDEKFVLASTLTFASVSLDDTADVEVVAVNVAGQDSSVAKLQVNMRTQKPEIIKLTEKQEVTEGEDCRFAAVVSGKPEPRLEWFLHDQLLTESSHIIITSEGLSHKLVIKDAELNHTGPVEVKVVNVAGEASASTFLKVNEKLIPPEIVLKLARLETLEESEVCFRCIVKGKPLPSIKWFHKGLELTADTAEKIKLETRVTDEPFELTSSLAFASVSMDDTADVEVVAVNVAGQDSSVAKLQVNMRTHQPQIIRLTENREVTEGEDCQFEADVSGKPEPRLEWFLRDQLLTESPTVIITKDGVNHKLVIKNVELNHTGPVEVKAVNVAGEATANTFLKVNEKLIPPEVILKLANLETLEESDVCFRCLVRGKPLPIIKWFHKGLELTADTAEKIKLETRETDDKFVLASSLMFASVSLDDTADVEVVAVNVAGQDNSVAKLHVSMRTQKPEILKLTENQEITEGDDCQFEAVVGGKPEPHLEWFLNDKSLTGSEHAVIAKDGSNHKLVIKDAELNHTGPIGVKATNVAGEAIASTFLKVNERLIAPEFILKVVNAEAVEESSVSFKCIVRGKPRPTLSWFQGAKEISVERPDVVITVSDTDDNFVLASSLTFTSVSLDDESVIKVVAKNSAGKTASDANLVVKMRTEPPRFVSLSAEQETIEGNGCEFAAVVVGKPEPTVHWFLDDQPLRESTNFIVTKEGSQHKLVLRDAELSHSGPIQVKAVNVAGEATANTLLTVIERVVQPKIIDHLKDAETLEETEVSFKCTVTGKPLPTVTWFQNDHEITPSQRVRTLTKSSETEKYVLTTTLTLSSVSLSDTSGIKVVAKNVAGSDISVASLQVNMRTERPRFIGISEEQEITEGEDCQFEALVTGKPDPIVEWFINDQKMSSLQQVEVMRDGSTYRLLIKTASLVLQGPVTVRAVNVAGEATASTSLKVKERLVAPEFIRKLEHVDAVEGDKVTFVCTVHGKPFPDVRWFGDGRELTDGRYEISRRLLGDGDVVENVLTVNSVEIEDAAELKAVATNAAGEDSTACTLNVDMRTEKPSFLHKPADQEIMEDEDASFEAVATGKPAPAISWYRGDNKLEPSGAIIVDNRESRSVITIRKAGLERTGPYTVRATNVAGTEKATAQLTVKERLVAPVFSLELSAYEALEDDPVYMKCSVRGKPLPDVKWYHSDRPIGADGRVQVQSEIVQNELCLVALFDSVLLADEGELRAVAENAAGKATTTSRLTVNKKPHFTKELVGHQITEDDECCFEVLVDGKPAPTVQWLFNGKTLPSCDRRTFQTDGHRHSLTIRNVLLVDSAEYTAKATNSVGEATSSESLKVLERQYLPEFISRPVDLESVEDGDVKFSCIVRGNPLPEIAWLKDGDDQSADIKVAVESIRRNNHEVSSTLTRKTLALGDAGEITVVARNSIGEVRATARLDVNMKTECPMVLSKLRDIEVNEGEECCFEVNVTGKPEPELSWFRSEKRLIPTNDVAISKDGNRYGLTLKNLRLLDAGTYTVKAVNIAGEVFDSAILKVNERLSAPFFVTVLSDVDVAEDGQATFGCVVQGKPCPELTWYLNDVDVTSGSSKIRAKTSRQNENHVASSLTVEFCSLDDAGSIVAVARNVVGYSSSRAALTVNMKTEKPSVVKGPGDIELNEDDDCHFEAMVTGRPEPTVQWFKGDNLLEASDRVEALKVGKRHRLVVSNCQLVDAGLYSVKVTNVAGDVTAHAQLTVLERHIPPVFVKKLAHQEKLEGDDAQFECVASGKPLPQVTWYRRGQEVDASSDLVALEQTVVDGKLKLTMTVSRLTLEDDGEVKAVARNVAGSASTSTLLTVNTRTEKPLILLAPLDAEVPEGDEWQFEAEVVGKPDPIVQWLKGDMKLTAGDRYTIERTDKRCVLRLVKTRPSDSGQYTVRAVNIAGEAASPFFLNVKEPEVEIYFARMLEDQFVDEGATATFSCEVFPPDAQVTWLVDGKDIGEHGEVSRRYRVTTNTTTGENQLVFVRATRADSVKVTAAAGDLESNAHLTVEASETEIVESRLFYELYEDQSLHVGAEFMCVHGDSATAADTVEVRASDDPDRVIASEPVQNASQRRWIVKKAYIDRDGSIMVERWSVRSYVDYTCSAASLVDVSLGILNDVRFTKQTVEFIVVLTAPCVDSIWFKDGRRVFNGRKFVIAVDNGGLLHTLTVDDVKVPDQGVYTFKIRETMSASMRYRIEAVDNEQTSDEARKRLEVNAAELLARLPGASGGDDLRPASSINNNNIDEQRRSGQRAEFDERRSGTAAKEAAGGVVSPQRGGRLQHQSWNFEDVDSSKNRHDLDGDANGSRGQLKRSKSCEFFWSQIRQFEEYDAVQTMLDQSFDQAAPLDLRHDPAAEILAAHAAADDDDDEVFSTTSTPLPADSPEKRSRSCRSLIFSETNVPIARQLVRSHSLPSISASGERKRRKSEVLYFSYAESGSMPISF